MQINQFWLLAFYRKLLSAMN